MHWKNISGFIHFRKEESLGATESITLRMEEGPHVQAIVIYKLLMYFYWVMQSQTFIHTILTMVYSWSQNAMCFKIYSPSNLYQLGVFYPTENNNKISFFKSKGHLADDVTVVLRRGRNVKQSVAIKCLCSGVSNSLIIQTLKPTISRNVDYNNNI